MLLNIKNLSFYPLTGRQYHLDDFCQMNLSQQHSSDFDVSTFEGLEKHVQKTLEKANTRAAYGGYMEQRNIYNSSEHFNNPQSENRNLHLGLDIWVPAKTIIYTPFTGKVHSFKYNDKVLDYGATIILQHEFEKRTFFSLYGHLSLNSLDSLSIGKPFEKEEPLAKTGDPSENGGWVPHLHFQLILDMEGQFGDYPGVAYLSDRNKYAQNCPDPTALFLKSIKSD